MNIFTLPELQTNKLAIVDFSGLKIPHGQRAHFGGIICANLLSISPESICSWTTLGLLPSTWQPTLNAVPRISFTHPLSSLEKDLKRISRAMAMISSRVTDLLCLMFFSFLRSRGGSFSARMMSDEAVGTTETAA